MALPVLIFLYMCLVAGNELLFYVAHDLLHMGLEVLGAWRIAFLFVLFDNILIQEIHHHDEHEMVYNVAFGAAEVVRSSPHKARCVPRLRTAISMPTRIVDCRSSCTPSVEKSGHICMPMQPFFGAPASISR